MSKKLILTPNAYKAGKVYAIKPVNGSGDFDFIRNTGRTRINENGNIEELSNDIVALDYQNGCPEILLEPQRTNEILDSDPLSDENSSNITSYITYNWSNDLENAVVVGNNTGSKFRYAGERDLDTEYTLSFYVEMNDGSEPIIGNENENNTDLVVRLGNNINKANTNKKNIKDNIWFIWTTRNTNNDLDGNGFIRYLDHSGKGFKVSGFQLEKGSYPTSYIPTNGSTVTRNKDTLSKDLTPIINSTYTMFLEVNADDSRLKIEDNMTGIEVPLNGSGKIAIQVDSMIKIIFPDNGQPQTELIYDKPDDLRNIDIVSKLAATRIGVIAIEDGVQDVSSWISGSVSSYFIETNWSAKTDLAQEFRDGDWDYFPAIDLSSGTNFSRSWRENNLTSFPSIDLSNGTDFELAWFRNNLTSFPANMFDTNMTGNYNSAFKNNDLNQTSVDNILISVNTSAQANNITNGDLGIEEGTNATPSQAGKDAADALFSNGWTVDLNGYTPS